MKTDFVVLFILKENEKSRDIIIEHRFHRTIIGTKGEKIREVRDKYPEVQVSFPDAGKKSDVVTLRGPRSDVDKVYAYMNKLNAELVRLTLERHSIYMMAFKLLCESCE